MTPKQVAEAMSRLVGTDASVFIWARDDQDEPEADVYLGSERFGELFLDALDAHRCTYTVSMVCDVCEVAASKVVAPPQPPSGAPDPDDTCENPDCGHDRSMHKGILGCTDEWFSMGPADNMDVDWGPCECVTFREEPKSDPGLQSADGDPSGYGDPVDDQDDWAVYQP